MFREIALGLVLLAASPLHAATLVSSGTTKVGDTGGVNLVGATSVLQNCCYSTPPAGADWVWDSSQGGSETLEWVFEFDLTGYNLSTASLNGTVGVDNTLQVILNGASTPIFSLPTITVANFSAPLPTFSQSGASLFNQGMNSVSFFATNAGGPAAFTASVSVMADPNGGTGPSPVPLPAGAPLLILGLAALHIASRARMAKGKIAS